MVAFAAAGSAHASGFLAAYLAAVVLANSGLPHRSATRSFAEGLGWLAQIGLFVLLGLLVDPSDLGAELVPAIVIGLVLLLVARPLSVFVSLAGFRVPWREQVFVSWAGLRGAVPIVLATFPIVAGVPDSIRLLNIVFILVVVYTLVQGPSLRPLAHRLGLIPKDATREIQVESAPLDVLEAELLTMTVQAPSRLHNVTVLELRLPDPSVITLIIRDGHTFVPLPDTRIAIGDELLIVTTTKTRAAAERRLRAVSRRGKLAYWFDEYGEAGLTPASQRRVQEIGTRLGAVRFAFKTSPQNTTWADMLAVWQAADDIEVFESGWTFDHFYPIFSDSTGPCLEGWTTLTALAQATKRLRVGVLVTGIHYRHPAVLANMAAALDIVSNGRLELGIGAGWNEEESGAYGIELGSIKERFDRFEEACEVLTSLLVEGDDDIRRQVLPAQGRPQRAQGPAAAAPADLHRRQRREAHAEDHGASTPSTGTSSAARRRSSPVSATCWPRTARTSVAIRRRSCCRRMSG